MQYNTFIVVIVSLSNNNCAARTEIKHSYAMGKTFGLRENINICKVVKVKQILETNKS